MHTIRLILAMAGIMAVTAACMPQTGSTGQTAEEAEEASTGASAAQAAEAQTDLPEEGKTGSVGDTAMPAKEEEVSKITEGPLKGVKPGRIFNTQKNELGEFTGGEPGDQTGHETRIDRYALYYRTKEYPWKYILHCTDPQLAGKAAELAALTAANDLVGYDSGSLKNTFWDHLEASNYDPASITIACSANCATSILSIYKAAGYQLGIEALQKIDHTRDTWSMGDMLLDTGYFEKITDSDRLHSPDYNHAGDIYVAPNRHVILQVTDGKKAD